MDEGLFDGGFGREGAGTGLFEVGLQHHGGARGDLGAKSPDTAKALAHAQGRIGQDLQQQTVFTGYGVGLQHVLFFLQGSPEFLFQRFIVVRAIANSDESHHGFQGGCGAHQSCVAFDDAALL